MRGRQKPHQQIVVDGVGQELAAHIAPLMDGAIDGRALCIGRYMGGEVQPSRVFNLPG